MVLSLPVALRSSGSQSIGSLDHQLSKVVVQEEWLSVKGSVLVGSWNKRPDLLQQVRWERMMFVLSMNRFNHLVYNIGGELEDFLSQWRGLASVRVVETYPDLVFLLAVGSNLL